MSRGARGTISVLVLIHLAAVVAPPLDFASTTSPDSRSPVMSTAGRLLRPYIEALFLNHGYAFFAPNPGSSFLLRADIHYEDGRPDEKWVLPDINRRVPRLLYHRHFMLSEHFNGLYAPPTPPPELENPELLAAWQRQRQAFVARRDSFLAHIRAETGAADVRLTRVAHRPPAVFEFLLENWQLDDPRLYRDLSDTGGEEQ